MLVSVIILLAVVVVVVVVVVCGSHCLLLIVLARYHCSFVMCLCCMVVVGDGSVYFDLLVVFLFVQLESDRRTVCYSVLLLREMPESTEANRRRLVIG